MNNIPSNIEAGEKLSLSEQREKLLELNPDIIYGVYDLIDNSNGEISLEMIDDVMTIYPNQLSNIKGLEECTDIVIVDLGTLRKGELNVIGGNQKSLETTKIGINPVLLSNGVIEYIEGKSGKKHLITTLRDGGAADSLQRTTTAGRNVGSNLVEEVEREHFEEGAFLGKNYKGEYTICIPAGNDKGFEYTKEAIEYWLKNKYNLSRESEQDMVFIKAFERSFPGIKYEELGNILKDISKNQRFMTYDWDNESIEGIEGDMKKISMNNGNGVVSEIDAFVYFDEANNTIEYRDIRRIKQIPKGFKLLGSRPCKLFLESQNQHPRVPRIENAFMQKSVPTIDYISRKVRDALEKEKETEIKTESKNKSKSNTTTTNNNNTNININEQPTLKL